MKPIVAASPTLRAKPLNPVTRHICAVATVAGVSVETVRDWTALDLLLWNALRHARRLA